jgi:hypothetical protein
VKWLDRDLITGPYLGLATTEAEFHKALRHLKIAREKWPKWLDDDSLGSAHSFTSPKGSLVCVVCMRPKNGADAIENAGTLIHEAVHVWQQFRDRICEHSPSREFEAYAIEAIAKNLMKAYAKTLA